MVKQFALMESLTSNLHDFLKKVSQNLSLPDKKSLWDAMVGLIRCGNPVVCKMARQLPDRNTAFVSRLDWLEKHLTDENNFDNKVKETLPQVWLPFMTDDTPIILDLSDIAKPLAKQMDYLAVVRDGSNGQLVNGYWLVEAYSSISRKNPVPILFEPLSHQEPQSPG